MRDPIFNVNGRLDGERPKPVAKVGVDEESAGHGGEGEVAAFSDAILIWGVWDGFLVGDAFISTIGGKFAFGEFGGVINAEKGDFGAAKVFSDSAKVDEMLKRLVARFHEVKTYVTRIATNEQNEIFETAVTRR